MVTEDKPKKFYCGVKDECWFKEHYVNCRCFAPYTIRQSCPHIVRKDKKTQREGSKEEAVLCE